MSGGGIKDSLPLIVLPDPDQVAGIPEIKLKKYGRPLEQFEG